MSYSTTPATSQTYLYENTNLPFALTGIIDEDGNRYATWTYDANGRGLSSQHAGGADLTTISYDDTTGNRTVTNALGEQMLYKFTALQDVPKVTEIDRSTKEDLGTYVAKVGHTEDSGRKILRAYSMARSHLGWHPALSAIFEVARDWEVNRVLALMTWIEGTPFKDFMGVFQLLAEEQQDLGQEDRR